MPGSRTATALLGVVLSLLVSAAAWWYFDTFLFFLVVPFVPFLFGSRSSQPPVRECPRCGFATRNPEYEFCPRDGTRLD